MRSTTIERIDSPRSVRIGGIRANARRSVYDDATDRYIGDVVSDSGPSTLGEATLTHIDRDADGVVVGGAVVTESGVMLALLSVDLWRIFPRRRLVA